MKTRACMLYAQEDVRIEEIEIGEPAAHEVLVRVGAGGICGSDIHYYWEGGVGIIRVSEPIIMGHEFSGTIEAIGEKVTRVKVGDRVAINPANPCGICKFCQEGLQHHCVSMRFFGSAMLKPHTHGGFRDFLIASETQCEHVGDKISLGEAACAEPLAVGLHAINQAKNVFGKKVLVTGAGPIGALLIGALKVAGAAEIVAMDISEAPLKTALIMGATSTINPLKEESKLMDLYSPQKGYFDAAFECTGVPPVFKQMFPVVRPQGSIVQVGSMSAVELPVGLLLGKEINLVGTLRFNREYAQAAQMLKDQRIDVRPVISSTLPMTSVKEALNIARDRTKEMKVQLSFT